MNTQYSQLMDGKDSINLIYSEFIEDCDFYLLLSIKYILTSHIP